MHVNSTMPAAFLRHTGRGCWHVNAASIRLPTLVPSRLSSTSYLCRAMPGSHRSRAMHMNEAVQALPILALETQLEI